MKFYNALQLYWLGCGLKHFLISVRSPAVPIGISNINILDIKIVQCDYFVHCNIWYIIYEPRKIQTFGAMQKIVHLLYDYVFVLNLYHDCTEKQQDPLELMYSDYKQLWLITILWGKKCSFAVFFNWMSNSKKWREPCASGCVSCDAAGESSRKINNSFPPHLENEKWP